MMFAEPGATPVTSPVLSTVAAEVLSELQATFLSLALGGLTVAISWSVAPTLMVSVLLLRVTPLTTI